ncbi:MAG: polysaccharide pyruvyl transferase family protein [Betaproteobacteria bacterium]
MKVDNTITIGLLWHSLSSDNLGVGALTVSQMLLCQQAAVRLGRPLKFVVFGTEGQLSYPPAGVASTQGAHFSLRRWLLGDRSFERAIEACDVVLDIGEGDSFTDIYGFRRLMFLLATKWAVLRVGRPLVLSPQTIGPFHNALARVTSRAVMRRCARVFARDAQSRAVLRAMGLDAVSDETIDVAFALPWQPPQARQPGGPVLIGLNVSGLLFSGGYSRNNQFGLALDYPELIRSLLRHWLAQAGVEVWLLPHVLASSLPVDDDRVAIRALATEFPSVKLAPEFKSPSEAKSFIAGMDFVTGARMHACIAALSAGVATGITFHPTDAASFSVALRQLLALYADKAVWAKVQKKAMAQDVSWTASAAKYAALYEGLRG